jgi:hypothetical protein
MKQLSVFQPKVILEIRYVFSKKRRILATMSKKHYNTVCAVLNGTQDTVEVLQAMYNYLDEFPDNVRFTNLKKMIYEIIKKKQENAQPA